MVLWLGQQIKHKDKAVGIFDDIYLEEEEKKKTVGSAPEAAVLSTEKAIPTVKKPIKTKSIFDTVYEESTSNDTEEVKAVKATKNSNKNSAIVDAARRFAEDRLGETEISDEEAIEEYIAHFRSFNVNELTAAGDYNYVSAAAADATERNDEKAADRKSVV